MPNKTQIDMKIWEINGYPINLEHYHSEVIIKDENGNSMRISKNNQLSIILDLNGSFKSG